MTHAKSTVRQGRTVADSRWPVLGGWLVLGFNMLFVTQIGCTTTAPMFVWQPSQVAVALERKAVANPMSLDKDGSHLAIASASSTFTQPTTSAQKVSAPAQPVADRGIEPVQLASSETYSDVDVQSERNSAIPLGEVKESPALGGSRTSPKPFSCIAASVTGASPETRTRVYDALIRSKPAYEGLTETRIAPLQQTVDDLVRAASPETNLGGRVDFASATLSNNSTAKTTDVTVTDIIHLARTQDVESVLMGQVLRDESIPRNPYDLESEDTYVLSMAWKVIDAETGLSLTQKTIALDNQLAEELYPDLEFVQEPTDKVTRAMVRQAWSIITPSIHPIAAPLARPYFGIGAYRIRMANHLAQEGRWDLAEEKWLALAKRYPFLKSAWHNLAMAAVANEDFELAEARMKMADWTWRNGDLADRSNYWLELRKHEYYRAHGIADPVEGWTIPLPVASQSVAIDGTQPQPIEELPWWSAIPFAKPPEWSWRQYLLQPIP